MAQHKISIVVDGKDNGASSTLDNLAGKIGGFGKSLQDLGGKLSLAVTAPLVGLGVAATKASTDLNAAMANVASLGVPVERVNELKTSVQEIAIEVGKSTDDIAGGLYQVISAFGDTADTVEILRINAIAAAAGLATTEDAIALTSAVTKGYGDTTADAVQKAADLAFVTVQLGQTTFPELAGAMGKVVPLAATLGITQEELFASMATLTGVTGNAAEVTTQLRATYQAIIRPTSEMSSALAIVAARLDDQERLVAGPLVDAWNKAQTELTTVRTEMYDTKMAMEALDTTTKDGVEAHKQLEKQYKSQQESAKELQKAVDETAAALGRAIIESVGQEEALRMLAETTGDNTNELSKMFGSVEALNAVLALTGAQAETYTEKLDAMQNSTGSLAAAFDAQTQGINASGFAMQQLTVALQVVMQRLGDGLAPALAIVISNLMPMVDHLLNLATAFSQLSPQTQTWIVGLLGAAAALGPVLMALGSFITAISTVTPIVTALAGGLGLLVSPIGLVAAGLAGLGVVMYRLNIGGFGDMVDGLVESVGRLAEGFSTFLGGSDFANFGSQVTAAFGDIWEAVTGFFSGDVSLDSLGAAITTGFETIKQAVADLFAGTDFQQFLTDINWSDFVESLTWENFVSTMSDWGAYIKGIDWTQFIVNALDWVTWVPALSWNLFVMAIDWNVFVGKLVWSQWLSKIDWKKTVDPLTWEEWITEVLDWADWVVKLPWSDWITSALRWGDFVAKLTWSSFVDKLKWPKIDLDWKQFIPEFPGWSSFWSNINPFGGGSEPSPGQNAAGTRFWRGGLSWVGEEGPELVNLPRGAQVFNSQRQMEMAGIAAGSVTINPTFVVNSQLDAQAVANQVLDIIKRGVR